MAFDLNAFVFSLVFFLVVSIIILVAFPIDKESKTMIYSYETHRNEYSHELDLTAIYLIVLAGLLVFLWWATRGVSREISSMRTATEILYDPNSSEVLSRHHTTLPCEVEHEQTLGEFSLGYLKAICWLNDCQHPIYAIAIANDNYSTTETRPRFNAPIISASAEHLELFSAIDKLKPTERRTFENQVKNVMKQLENADDATREFVMKRVEKSKEDEEREE